MQILCANISISSEASVTMRECSIKRLSMAMGKRDFNFLQPLNYYYFQFSKAWRLEIQSSSSLTIKCSNSLQSSILINFKLCKLRGKVTENSYQFHTPKTRKLLKFLRFRCSAEPFHMYFILIANTFCCTPLLKSPSTLNTSCNPSP